MGLAEEVCQFFLSFRNRSDEICSSEWDSEFSPCQFSFISVLTRFAHIFYTQCSDRPCYDRLNRPQRSGQGGRHALYISTYVYM